MSPPRRYFFWPPPLLPPPSSAQVTEATASPLTELERAVYREPPSPSAPFAGTAVASPPRVLLAVNRAASQSRRRASTPEHHKAGVVA
jgi:hypothetical protein